jgi:hypothetical protein
MCQRPDEAQRQRYGRRAPPTLVTAARAGSLGTHRRQFRHGLPDPQSTIPDHPVRAIHRFNPLISLLDLVYVALAEQSAVPITAPRMRTGRLRPNENK